MTSLRIRGYYLIIIYFYLQLVCCVHFTRYDHGAYLAARLDTKDDTYDGKGDSSINIKDQIRRINSNDSSNDENQQYYDDPNKCTTYLAPSSIRNSGLGMFTTTPYQKDEQFPFPEIGMLLQERAYHYSYTNKKEKLLSQYPWAAEVLTLGGHEVGYGETITPGLGMLANCHLGLMNMKHTDILWKVEPWRDGTDSLFRTDSLTMEDVGRGAHSWHGRVMFGAHAPIQAGEELFVSYGDEWFTGREELLGIVPGEAHFREADELLRSFTLENERKVGEGQEENHADRSANYWKLLKDALKKDKRLRVALPKTLQDVPEALALGTARFSAKDSIRSIAWLEENGACIDNIVAGVSTIPQAGRGAFATRSINEGDPITTTPVVTLEREELNLWEKIKQTDEGGAVMELMGHQLLLNYCYGVTNSSLLFFPYAPSVNFINHGSVEDSNAEIRWSKAPYHQAEWLNTTVDEMKDKLKTGLLFDIIATRDIRRGEEILLFYGKDWEENWDEHIKEWASMDEEDVDDDRPILNLTERLGVPTTNDLNQIEQNPTVRTKDEQSDDPYPPYIMTRCHFEPPENCIPPKHSTDIHCQSRWKLTFDPLQLHNCTILSRESIGGIDWYTAQVEVTLEGKIEITLHLVEYMTRDAIRFVDRPYSKDQYAHGVFRQVIGLPDGIMPMHWMDLNGGEMTTDEVELQVGSGEEEDGASTRSVT